MHLHRGPEVSRKIPRRNIRETSDCNAHPHTAHLSRSDCERTETAIQTDFTSQRAGSDTTRSLGPTTLLRDTAIRAEEAAARRRESTKTAVLLALSRPSRPISRSQSQVTVAGEAWCGERHLSLFLYVCVCVCSHHLCGCATENNQEKKQKGKGPQERSTLQRSKTLVNLLFRGGRKTKSPSTNKAGKGEYLRPLLGNCLTGLRGC